MKRLGNDQRPNSLQPIAYSLHPIATLGTFIPPISCQWV